ncbi:MAG: glycosyltransferase family 9 protein, partial [Acidobacteriaceae bacterium]
DEQRSMALGELLPLAGVPGVSWFSLQMGRSAGQLRELAAEFPIADACSAHRDFAETAALAATLDLVISVDTSIAHLAGAMGIPVWVILPQLADWRWMDEREDSPWYPTARLFRQERAGDWSVPVERMRQELQRLAADPGAGRGVQTVSEWKPARVAGYPVPAIAECAYVTGCGAGMGPG